MHRHNEHSEFGKFQLLHDTRRDLMTRGRKPIRAQEDANLIAEKRGIVQHYLQERGLVCDFSIMGPERITFGRFRRARRIRCSIEEIEWAFPEDIAVLRFIVSSLVISRELWIYSPKGVWRFFRILDGSILELGRDGLPLAVELPAETSAGLLPVKGNAPAIPVLAKGVTSADLVPVKGVTFAGLVPVKGKAPAIPVLVKEETSTGLVPVKGKAPAIPVMAKEETSTNPIKAL
jgi:hypothetical protein